MAGVCARQFCDATAAARVDFDGEARVVWIDDLGEGRPAAACFLCPRHADRLTPPRHWDLHDLRRTGSHEPAPDPGAAPILVDPAGRRASAETEVGSDEVGVGAPPTSPAWSPHLFPRGDLDGVLDARSPLLSRAFGNVRAV